ncbi:MAG: stage II sporulation protein P [Oscillospiraceae bacterium]|jgi:stage II sporulation protein P|nr:stage II sporulation protein P [Oscillospiraceae bacterium]
MRRVVKRLMLIVIAAAIVKLAVSARGAELLGSAVIALAENEQLTGFVLRSELGLLRAEAAEPTSAAEASGESAESSARPALAANPIGGGFPKLTEEEAAPETPAASAAPNTNTAAEDAKLPAPNSEADAPGAVRPKTVVIDNGSSYNIDVPAMLEEDIGITLPANDAPQILIIHTHTSEAYSQTEGFRTLDKTMSVVRVGDALTRELTEKGYNVIHDREVYDYPSYNGSYNRTAESVKTRLAEFPTIQIVFDLHRDALEQADGSQYRSTYRNGDTEAAQLMLIAATGSAGLSHPNWKTNLRFALNLQANMDAKYPGLTRPLLVSAQRYNEQLAPGYLLLEVGSTGNTIDEAVTAIRLFAECFSADS